jgi:hypothetical protein
MMVGRWDFMLAALRQGLVSLNGMKTQLARDWARDQLMYAPRFLVADDLKSNRLTRILPTFQTVGLTPLRARNGPSTST